MRSTVIFFTLTASALAENAWFNPDHLLVTSGNDLVEIDYQGNVIDVISLQLAASTGTAAAITVSPRGPVIVARPPNVITQIGGDGTILEKQFAGFPGFRHVAFGPQGRLYVSTDDRIIVYELGDPVGGELNLVEVDQIGESTFSSPEGFAFRADGTLIVADSQADCMWRVTPEGDVNGILAFGLGAEPADLAIGRDGTVFMAAESIGHILAFDGDDGAALGFVSEGTSLAGPHSLTMTGAGTLIVVDSGGQIYELPAVVGPQSGRLLATDPAFAQAYGVVAPPFALRCDLTGDVFRAGGDDPEKFKEEKASIAIYPGSGMATLRIEKTSIGSLAEALGQRNFTFFGFENFELDWKDRGTAGLETVGPPGSGGIATLSLRVTGKPSAWDLANPKPTPQFEVTKLKGSLSLATSEVTGVLTVKSVKKLN